MQEESLLETYGRARDGWFDGLVTRLRADSRVLAAWLSGAHGRDEDDEWSDFDLHVAVTDNACQALLADPRGLFELAGEPLLVQANFPSESMPEGRFWLAVYSGPYEVDWNIGPISAAQRPQASRVLFEHLPVPVADGPSPLTSDEARQAAQQALDFFWAMLPIAIKYAGRGWTRRAVQQEGLLSGAWQRLWGIANRALLRSQDAYDQNRRPLPELLSATPAFGPVIDGEATLHVLEGYCDAVEKLHPRLAELGVSIPNEMPRQVRTLLAVPREQFPRGEVRPGTGGRR